MPTYLIHSGPNPTLDFYFAARSHDHDIHWDEEPSQLEFDATDTLIFIRYINSKWRRYLQRLAVTKRPVIVFFMDDDVLDTSIHKGLPFRYQWKLYKYAARHTKWLKTVGAQLWVSTPWLMQKYHDWNPTYVPPQSPYTNTTEHYTIFYHGSASHEAEIQWLVPVIEHVLKLKPNLNFEIIGAKKIRKLFKNTDRVHVLHPMSWYSYRSLISSSHRCIGLAPLLDTPFNQARSVTKVFDITHAGAVGIYTNHFVYSSIIEHRSNGYLLPMDKEIWVNSIIELTENETMRQEILKRAQETVINSQYILNSASKNDVV